MKASVCRLSFNCLDLDLRFCRKSPSETLIRLGLWTLGRVRDSIVLFAKVIVAVGVVVFCEANVDVAIWGGCGCRDGCVPSVKPTATGRLPMPSRDKKFQNLSVRCECIMCVSWCCFPLRSLGMEKRTGTGWGLAQVFTVGSDN